MPDAGDGRPTALAYFDHVADAWADAYRAPGAGGRALRERRERALDGLVGTSGRLLDIGCGSGAMAGDVASRGFRFYGVDASLRMIEAGTAAFEEAGGRTGCVGLAEALPFGDASFDAALCLGVIGAVDDRDRAIAEARRILRPGGTLVISFSNLASPYAFWKGYVVYPLGSLLAAVTRRVVGRPTAPRRATRVGLYTARSSARLLRRHGLSVRQITYYDFNLLLSPLDRVLGPVAEALADRLSRLATTRARPLGAAFLATAVVDG